MSEQLYPPPVISNFFTDRTVTLFPFLAISIILGLFLDYVILTQSKTLGTFKYYLLNQAIWAQVYEILMIMLNPVFLTPYFAGYMGGIFRNTAGYAATSALNTLCFSLFLNNVVGVILSLLNRYILTFHPEWRRYLENKYTISLIAAFHISIYVLNVTCYFTAPSDSEISIAVAKNETGTALLKYYNEPTFIYFNLDKGFSRKLCLFFCIAICGLSAILLLGVAVFTKNVFFLRKTKGAVSKTSQYLLISAFVQVVVCVLFLLVPFGWLVFALAFNIQNSTNVTNAFIMLVSTHGFVDIVSTLYFIKPYKKYCFGLVGVMWKKRIEVPRGLLFLSRTE